MPPFDIPGARGRGNPHPRRRRSQRAKRRSIPTKLYTPLTGAGRRSTPRRVVTRNHRAVVTKQRYRPNPKRVISHTLAQRGGHARAAAYRSRIPGAGKVLAAKQRADRKKPRSQTARVYSTRIPGAARILSAKRRADRLPPHPHERAASIPGVLPIARAKYQQYNQDLWNRAKTFYPSDTMPSSRVMEGNEGIVTLMGQTGRRDNRVSYTPSVALSYLLRDEGRNFAASVPLHEWAHAFQPDDGRPTWVTEGGAEAFEQDVARALRLPFQTSPTYAKYVRRVRRRKSRPYVDFDQFR